MQLCGLVISLAVLQKGVFPSHFCQVRAHGASCSCWGFLCIILGSLPYYIKHYINKTKLKLIKFVLEQFTRDRSIFKRRFLFAVIFFPGILSVSMESTRKSPAQNRVGIDDNKYDICYR